MIEKEIISAGCSCCTDCTEPTAGFQSNNSQDCSCGPNCCGDQPSVKIEKKPIVIDFLYLDLSVCTRCQGTDKTLDDALLDVSKVLEITGVEVIVNKVNVLSEEKAIEYQFLSSPTIRVNGRDIQMEVRENTCESCGDLCGDHVDCRVWVYQGVEYTEPPKAMVVEAILKEVYENNTDNIDVKEYVLPENLKQFYQSMKAKDAVSSNNCG